jgi:hypothetical protein
MSERMRLGRDRFQGLGERWHARASAEYLSECRDGFGCRHRGLAACQGVNGLEQAANESWGQPGYPVPDSRPLSGEVISPGHGYQSYTGAARAARGIHEHASQHSH